MSNYPLLDYTCRAMCLRSWNVCLIRLSGLLSLSKEWGMLWLVTNRLRMSEKSGCTPRSGRNGSTVCYEKEGLRAFVTIGDVIILPPFDDGGMKCARAMLLLLKDCHDALKHVWPTQQGIQARSVDVTRIAKQATSQRICATSKSRKIGMSSDVEFSAFSGLTYLAWSGQKSQSLFQCKNHIHLAQGPSRVRQLSLQYTCLCLHIMASSKLSSLTCINGINGEGRDSASEAAWLEHKSNETLADFWGCGCCAKHAKSAGKS